MVTISLVLQDKIERRSRRAFRRFDEEDKRRIHRVTGVSTARLKYRISRRCSQSVEVLRQEHTIVIDPPTTGLIDVLKKDDIKKLKNSTDKLHAGEVVAYLLAGTSKKVGKTYKKPDRLLSRAQCVDQIKVGQRVYVVDLQGADIDSVTYDHFMASNFTVTSELDAEKDLGFTTGLFDLQSKDDVIKLRKKKHLGRVRAYKYVTKEGKSPTRSKDAITYKVGKDYEIKNADTDPGSNCHVGVNVADIEWAKSSATGNNRLFAFEFEMKDIAAIPTNTDGKFRVHRCKCVEELDLKTLKPIKPLPKPVEENGKQVSQETKKTTKKKKRGLMDRLLGRKDDEDDS